MLTSPLSGARAAAPEALTGPEHVAALELPGAEAGRWRLAAARIGTSLGPLAWPVAVYSASRLLLLMVAALAGILGGHAVAPEFFLFDGQWYLRLAEHGYPAQALRGRSTLGFLPLYPLAMRALALLPGVSLPRAALATAMLGGLAAAVLVQRLGTAWWGERAGRWATVAFCMFPGSIVFSMGYSEGLTVPLAAGCLLALNSRRWWLAGLLAALATVVEPAAVVLMAVCVAAAGRQLRGRGWRDRQALRSLAAPLLAPLGLGGFAVFLWAWTGSPFAAIFAQHYGWHQQSQPLALLGLPVARHVLGHPPQLLAHVFTWNIWNGVVGGVFLALSIAALIRVRRQLSAGALVLSAGIGLLTLWSVMTPPNMRMVLIAFPAVMVWGLRLSGRRLGFFLGGEVLMLVLTSLLTYSGHMLP